MTQKQDTIHYHNDQPYFLIIIIIFSSAVYYCYSTKWGHTTTYVYNKFFRFINIQLFVEINKDYVFF